MKIERGDYRHVWSILPEAYRNKSILYEEKLWLQARILFDQGAQYLALKSLDSLEFCIKNKANKKWAEELFTLRSDIYYQLSELELYLQQIELLEKWRIRNYPRDSIRMAMNYTYRAKYFSAMIKFDSATINTCKALNIYWNNRKTTTELPIYLIYANHVSCLRNGQGFPFDVGFARTEAYIDTCVSILNKRFPNNCIEKLRIIQALAVPYFDRASGIQAWINPTQMTVNSYREFRARVLPLLILYKKLAGKRHPYISQIEYFLGLLETYRKNNKSAISHFQNAKTSNSSSPINLPIYVVSWRKSLSFLKFLSRLKYEEASEVSKMKSLLNYRNELMEAETVFYMRHFYQQSILYNAEDDVYKINPFAELSWVNLLLFKHSKNPEYLAKAWNYAQKDKYLDVLKNKINPEKKFIAQKITSVLSRQIGLLRWKNDSLILAENEFASFSKISKSKLASEVYQGYAALTSYLQKINIADPFSANYLTGQFTYSIKALQQNLTQQKSAWISVNHFLNEKESTTILWVICPDTIWVQQCEWPGDALVLRNKLHEKLIRYDSDSINVYSNKMYQRIFKSSAEALKKRGIHRLYYCDDPSTPIGNPELWATDVNPKKPRYLIHDFSITFALSILPDVLLGKKQQASFKNNTYSICPQLTNQYVNLSLARTYSDSISQLLRGKAVNHKISKNDFLRTLKTARILQLFTHGEGEKGLVFSDGNLLPEEVRGLNIDADLVSLAACESSNGKLIAGEGVKGMTEALIYAGAKRVISSNWKIDEKTTASIMLDFYRNISLGMRADSSMRLAKIKYLNEAAIGENNPSFWGGIVLYGNPEAIAVYKRAFPLASPLVIVCCTVILFILLLSVQYQFRITLIRFFKRFQSFF